MIKIITADVGKTIVIITKAFIHHLSRKFGTDSNLL